MTLLDIDTDFHRRTRSLKPPTSAAFNLSEWENIYADVPNKLTSDEMLLGSARWVAAQSFGWRKKKNERNLYNLDSSTAAILAVASVNREFLITSRIADHEMALQRASGTFSFAHMVQRPLPSGHSQQSISIDDATSAVVDAAESWLFDVFRIKHKTEIAESDLSNYAANTMRRYCLQRGLNDLWYQCYWEGWRLVDHGDRLVWEPGDRNLATRLEAARIRQSENFMNYPWIDISAWTSMKPEFRRKFTLPRTVTKVEQGRWKKIRVERPSCLSRRPPSYLIEKAGLEGSYLDFVLDQEFPINRNLSVNFLLKVWHIIHDLAVALVPSRQLVEFTSINSVNATALVLWRSELIDVLVRSLHVKKDLAESVVTFLSFKPKVGGEKGHRGLWSTPIVCIPDTDQLALLLPVLAISNPLRKIESWLEKGGIDNNLRVSSRGNVYETTYRERIRKGVTGNPVFQKARCAKFAIKRTDDFSEQIDLLVKIGTRLIVGEIKCWIFPADPIERYNHFKKIREAATQANRKATLLSSRLDIVAQALDLNIEECRHLNVTPLVIMNQGFGFSLQVNGCIVTDSRFFLNYVSSGSIASGMALDPKSGQTAQISTKFYERESQADERFENIFMDPPVLRRFIDRITWERIPFPTAEGGSVYIAVPRLEDLGGDERLSAIMLNAAVSGAR